MPEDRYDARIAAAYDASVADQFRPEVVSATVDFLSEYADDGRALEFAVGTGRIALPLSRRGVDVSGIELSPAMVEQLRAKHGSEAIDVTIGDMATTRVGGTFMLVYLVFNTIMNLQTQDEQVACFQNAADHLEPGGHFVIEVIVPALQRLPLGETLVAFDASDGHAGVDRYDVVNQTLVSRHYFVGDGEVLQEDSPHRYAYPAEYDLMAKMAGLSLVGRWADWQREPFTATSPSHVSVWVKP